MTGKEKIAAAFSSEGSDLIPVVLPYENLFARDHWSDITSYPWWYQFEVDYKKQADWHCELLKTTGFDWFRARLCMSHEDRKLVNIEVRPDGVYKIDMRSGNEILIPEPIVGTMGVYPEDPEVQPDSREMIDELILLPEHHDPQAVLTDGRGDLTQEIFRRQGNILCSVFHVPTPLWRCTWLWSYENLMIETALNPALVEYAAKRYLQQAVLEVRECAALGVETIWLEECLTDIISPETFSRINIPIMTALVDEIRSLGMKSIYYYTGNPTDRFKHILSVGADAIALEEGKKGFTIDIEEVVDSVNGRCTVLGNLDAIGILEQGSEDELRAEITRQINAGRRNGGRFIMSIGSPATPGTSLERLCLYREMSHEIGASQ
jgi:hypothetical protein